MSPWRLSPPPWGVHLRKPRQRLLIGPKSACGERLSAYAQAGVERMLVWPIGDDLEQLELFSGSFMHASS